MGYDHANGFVINDAGGGIVARSGDRVGFVGSEGWYAPDSILVQFDPAVLPVAEGTKLERRAVVRAWAAQHGLAYSRGYADWRSNWWRFTITDGSTPSEKALDIQPLPEVHNGQASEIPLGSFCMVGRPFTVTGVIFLEPGPSPTPMP